MLRDYAEAKFVEKTPGDHVDFVMHSRPFFLTVFNASNYHKRTHMEDIGKDIPLADAKWIGGLLGQLSMDQILDCFRAAGYDAATANGYTSAVQERISELKGLKSAPETATN